jgi:hypothetical protein
LRADSSSSWIGQFLIFDWSIPRLGLNNLFLIHCVADHFLSKLETDMIYVRLNTLLLCSAILGRTILTAGLILCFGTMPIVQVANAQSPVAIFNCPSGFASSGSCGVSMIGSGGQPFAIVGGQNGSTPGLSGSQVDLVPAGAVHTGLALNYQTPVNVQSFSSTFTFIPNGWNVAFVINNSTRDGGGKSFAAGAGCEGGFFQGFDTAPPNNVFALELDSQSPLTENGSFTYSSVQIYQSGESPCLPNLGGTDFTYVPIDKVSTSPVNLTTGSALTTTGDVYSATVTYDGSNLTISLYDVTAGGSCPGATCFTKSWSGINIPSIAGSSNTAWVGLTAGTNQSVPNALLINTFSYSSLGPALQVTPATNIAASGTQGGPFSPSSISYTLSATTGSVNYTVTNVPNWLTASTASGTVTSGTPVTVTFTVNANANSLAANTYSGTINFTNSDTGQGSQTRTASLTVNAASTLQVTPAINVAASGTQGGPFSPSSFSYTLSATTGSVSYTVTNVPNWLTASTASGTVTSGTPVTVTFTVNANANSLAANTYSGTINFTNLGSGQGSQTRTASLTVNAASTAALQVTPATNIAASGTQGGPFLPASFSYSFSSTTGTVNYSITNVPSWLTVSSSSGTATTSPQTITFSINSNANNLSAGAYVSGINFNNTTNNQGNKSITATLTDASGAGKTPSLNGTTIPSATQITDAQLNVWTVASGVIYENGGLAGYSADVVLLLYYNGVIYQENSAGGWWSWVNSNWSGVTGDPRTPSLNGTTIPSATQITDAQLNVWTVASVVIYENGGLAGYSTNVVLLLYYNGVIYQENSAGGWWSWVNSNWSGVAGDPRLQ